MTPLPANQSLAKFLEEYEIALAVFAHLGVRVGNGRLHTYRKRLLKAVTAELEDPNGALPHQSDPLFLNALLEAREIIEIAELDTELLSNHDSLTKLRQLIRGPETLNPAKDDPGRNYAFEFSTAALAARNGRLIGLSASDLEVGPPACPVECKRISSIKRLASNISGARAQLAGGTPGIIALDLSTPIRAERGLSIPCDSEDAQQSLVDQELAAYLKRHIRRATLEIAGDTSVLGLIVRHRLVGSVGAVHEIRTAATWQLISFHTRPRLDLAFLKATEFLGDLPIIEGTSNDLTSAHNEIFGNERLDP